MNISFMMTLRLLYIRVGRMEVRLMNILRAFTATLVFGSFICLLKTSIILLFDLCWRIYST